MRRSIITPAWLEAQRQEQAKIDAATKDGSPAPAPPKKMVPFSAMFRYATAKDKLLMFLGILGAMGGGASMPGFSLVFGEILNVSARFFSDRFSCLAARSLMPCLCTRRRP